MTEKPLVANASNPEQVEAAGKKQVLGRERDLEDVRFLLSDVRGRRVFRKYLEHCGVFETTYTGNSETFLREGRRQVGLKLWADMSQAAPEVWPLMMLEKAKYG